MTEVSLWYEINESNNAVYHVTFRGNNRQMILKEDEDKESFLRTLSKYKQRFKFSLYAFVLMNNHVHLAIGTNHLFNISKIMQAILLSYSQKFRKKYSYSGHVWQGRFKSNVIEDDSYILKVIEYIHNNPVRAKISPSPNKYPWSSFCFYHSTKHSLIREKIEVDVLGDTSNINH
jgi:REP element-mobilizing transposase RayT